MRKPKMVTVNLYGVEATAETRAFAKQDAERRLEALVERIGAGPRIFEVHDLTCVVWRGESGWATKVLYDGTPKDGRLWGSSEGERTLASAIISVVSHACQLAWHHGINEADDAFIRAPLEGIGTRAIPFQGRHEHKKHIEDAVDEFSRWARFQRAYKRIRSQGVPDSEAHQMACRESWNAPQAEAAA